MSASSTTADVLEALAGLAMRLTRHAARPRPLAAALAVLASEPEPGEAMEVLDRLTGLLLHLTRGQPRPAELTAALAHLAE
jgi:hypothetical protein